MRYFTLLIILMVCCEAKYVPEDGVYAVSETMPSYESGISALNEYVNNEVQKADLTEKGSVFVSFIVTTDGQVGETTIINGASDLLNEKAISILKNAPGKWVPGTEEGQPVEVKMVYPVRF